MYATAPAVLARRERFCYGAGRDADTAVRFAAAPDGTPT
jgi:hypothetical protein